MASVVLAHSRHARIGSNPWDYGLHTHWYAKIANCLRHRPADGCGPAVEWVETIPASAPVYVRSAGPPKLDSGASPALLDRALLLDYPALRGHTLIVAAIDPSHGRLADDSDRCGPLPPNWVPARHGPHFQDNELNRATIRARGFRTRPVEPVDFTGSQRRRGFRMYGTFASRPTSRVDVRERAWLSYAVASNRNADMSPTTSPRVRITLGPRELQKLVGPAVIAKLSGVAALIEGAAKGQVPREALDRAIDLSSHNLFAMYEQNYDSRHQLDLPRSDCFRPRLTFASSPYHRDRPPQDA